MNFQNCFYTMFVNITEQKIIDRSTISALEREISRLSLIRVLLIKLLGFRDNSTNDKQHVYRCGRETIHAIKMALDFHSCDICAKNTEQIIYWK